MPLLPFKKLILMTVTASKLFPNFFYVFWILNLCLNQILSMDLSMKFWVVFIFVSKFFVRVHVCAPYVKMGIIQLLKIWFL